MWDIVGKFFFEELKTHPRLLVIMMMMITATVGASLTFFVQLVPYNMHLDEYEAHLIMAETAVEDVSKQIVDLQTYIETKELRQEIRATESELFSLEKAEENGQVTQREILRIRKLKSDMREALDDLRRVEARR